MRKQSLRQIANRYLKMDNRGSFRDKKQRAFVIHKMIDDLFIVGEIPPTWWNMNNLHIRKLVQHWQKHKIKPATIMGYMTIIRGLLNAIECKVSDIDNQSLGLNRQYTRSKKSKIKSDIWQNISDPSARLIMAMQTQFGLTFSEAIHFVPDIHIREYKLWITREIAFNSTDRMIPLRNEMQHCILQDFIKHTDGNRSLSKIYGYQGIRHQWRTALNMQKLPVNQSYRYLYAQNLKKELSPVLGNYQTNWLIRDEMGIKSYNTLWLYLHE